MVGGLTLQALGMGWIALIADPGLTYSEFVLPSIVAGVGVSMAIPAAQNSVVGSVALEDVGKAAGANSMMRELGGVFGVAVAAAVFAGAGSFASADAFLDGFAPAIAVLAAFSLAGAIVALALPGRRRAAESAPVGAVPALEAEGGRLITVHRAMPPPRSNPVVHLELHTGDLPQARASTRSSAAGARSGSRREPAPTSPWSSATGSGAASSSAVSRARAGCPTSRSPRSPRRPTGPRGSGRRCSWSPERARPGGEASSPPRPAARSPSGSPRPGARRCGGRVNEGQLLEAARAGDEDAFARLVEPHRGALHAHCYRMLGSVPDAEDALQEALLSAWRGLPGFEGRSSLRSWLYTIATNACLRAIERRPKRVLPIDYGPAADPHDGLGEPLVESVWVEPYPDESARPRGRARRPGGALRAARERRARLHRGAPAPAGAPARRAHPPRRARLLGARGRPRRSRRRRPGSTARCSAPTRRWTSGFPSAASRLCSARSTTSACARSSTRFVDAWERADVDAVVAMLASDGAMTMPPLPTWYRGREAVAAFLEGGR